MRESTAVYLYGLDFALAIALLRCPKAEAGAA
jgi:hypothetical protein